MSATQPGSRAHELVQLVDALVGEKDRGVTIGEIREAYEHRLNEPAPGSLTSEISSLKRRGVLAIVGGRPGHSLYAPANRELDPHQRQDDDGIIVLEALKDGFARRGRPLTTREVREEIERQGQELSSDNPDAVRKRLEALARSHERGPAEFHEPQIQRISVETIGGFPSNYWLPADEEPPSEGQLPPRSEAEAVRRAVTLAVLDLGRPISRSELRWWLDWPEADDLVRRTLDPDGLGEALHSTIKSDRAVADRRGRLQEVGTEFVCHGGPDPRYATEPVDDQAASLCALEDAATALRLRAELRSLRALEGQVQGGIYPEPVIELVDTRRSLVAETLGSMMSADEPGAVIDHGREVGEILRTWIREATLTRDQAQTRRRTIRERREQLDAAESVLRFLRPDRKVECARVGEAATATLDELDSFLDPAADLLDLPPERARGLVERVRRFPPPEMPGRERIGSGVTPPLSVLDRPEALVSVFEAFSVPRANVSLQAAHGLLGHVLRDAELLHRLLEELPDRPGDVHRSIWVALGLLGELVEPDEEHLDHASFEDVAAWVLACVLAGWEAAPNRVRELDRQTEGAARRVTDMAAARLEAGMPVSVVG